MLIAFGSALRVLIAFGSTLRVLIVFKLELDGDEVMADLTPIEDDEDVDVDVDGPDADVEVEVEGEIIVDLVAVFDVDVGAATAEVVDAEDDVVTVRLVPDVDGDPEAPFYTPTTVNFGKLGST